MRKTSQKWLVATACIVMAVSIATAQNPRGDGREGPGNRGPGRERQGGRGNPLERGRFMLRVLKDAELLKASGITEEQAEALKAKLFDFEKREIELQAEMRKASLKQARLLADSSTGKDALMEAVEEVGAARTELAKLAMERILAVRSCLDEQQIQTLMEKTRERFMERHPRRPRDGEGRPPRNRPGGDRNP